MLPIGRYEGERPSRKRRIRLDWRATAVEIQRSAQNSPAIYNRSSARNRDKELSMAAERSRSSRGRLHVSGGAGRGGAAANDLVQSPNDRDEASSTFRGLSNGSQSTPRCPSPRDERLHGVVSFSRLSAFGSTEFRGSVALNVRRFAEPPRGLRQLFTPRRNELDVPPSSTLSYEHIISLPRIQTPRRDRRREPDSVIRRRHRPILARIVLRLEIASGYSSAMSDRPEYTECQVTSARGVVDSLTQYTSQKVGRDVALTALIALIARAVVQTVSRSRVLTHVRSPSGV